MSYSLTSNEKKRLVAAIRAVFAIPFIDDVEDYIWEAVFAYTKNIQFVDPLLHTRSKRLFDVIDTEHKIGWSIKAAQKAFELPCELEIVIQRADILKKAHALGFEPLSVNSPTEQLGAALLKHWYTEKVAKDAAFQNIADKRVCILLKSLDKKHFVYYEEDLIEYTNEDLIWHWTDATKTGLQARRRADKRLVFRWYPNQKHFFERFSIPAKAYSFTIEPQRLLATDLVELLLAKLEGRF